MRNHAAERDPARNANFSRRWADDPLQLPDLQHLGREIVPGVVEDVGRHAIAHWLDTAAQAQGATASKAFQQADAIRRRLGLAWTDLIDQRSAA